MLVGRTDLPTRIGKCSDYNFSEPAVDAEGVGFNEKFFYIAI